LNPWRNETITKQVLEQPTEEEDNPWTLESQTKTSRTGSQSASIVTNMDTWQKNADWKRRNEKHEHVSNATRKNTLPRIIKENRQ